MASVPSYVRPIPRRGWSGGASVAPRSVTRSSGGIPSNLGVSLGVSKHAGQRITLPSHLRGGGTMLSSVTLNRPPGIAGKSAFTSSFSSLTGQSGIGQVRGVAYRNFLGTRQVGKRVGIDLDIRADERMKRFMRRLPRASREVKLAVKKTIRVAVQKEILPTLRREIPMSKKGKGVTRVTRDVKIHRTKRGRRGGMRYGTKEHIRRTATIGKQYPDGSVLINVGNPDLWYGAIIHAKLNPYFTKTMEKTFPKFNRRVTREMEEVLNWVGNGTRRKMF